jgi:hypothetical protein
LVVRGMGAWVRANLYYLARTVLAEVHSSETHVENGPRACFVD